MSGIHQMSLNLSVGVMLVPKLSISSLYAPKSGSPKAQSLNNPCQSATCHVLSSMAPYFATSSCQHHCQRQTPHAFKLWWNLNVILFLIPLVHALLGPVRMLPARLLSSQAAIETPGSANRPPGSTCLCLAGFPGSQANMPLVPTSLQHVLLASMSPAENLPLVLNPRWII